MSKGFNKEDYEGKMFHVYQEYENLRQSMWNAISEGGKDKILNASSTIAHDEMLVQLSNNVQSVTAKVAADIKEKQREIFDCIQDELNKHYHNRRETLSYGDHSPMDPLNFVKDTHRNCNIPYPENDLAFAASCKKTMTPIIDKLDRLYNEYASLLRVYEWIQTTDKSIIPDHVRDYNPNEIKLGE